MTGQWRFAEKRARLANLVAYSGQPSAVQPHQCDIIVIDCDAPGSALNNIRRPHGGWAGTPPSAPWCPAPSPSTNHGRDATIGVVVRYNAQSRPLTNLSPKRCGPDSEVVTAHTFQDRECDAVIFDLEDGRRPLAKASINGGAGALGGRPSVQRYDHPRPPRLYLIADGAAKHPAATDHSTARQPYLRLVGLPDVVRCTAPNPPRPASVTSR